MTLNSLDVFTEFTDDMAIYVESAQKFIEQSPEDQVEFLKLVYTGSALAGEVGEMLNILMQAFRNAEGKLTPAENEHLMLECGDCLFYLVRFMMELGYDPTEVIAANIQKLARRKKKKRLAHATVAEGQSVLPGFDIVE